MSTDKNIPRLISQIRPRYIILVTLVIAVVMIFSAVFELSQSKKELNRLMSEEAASLIETVDMSSVNTVLSNEEIENLISQRLLSAARMTAYLDSIRTLSQKDLKMIAKENGAYRINIFNREGDKVLSSFIPDSTHLNAPSKHEPKEFFEPILEGEKEEIIIGLKEARHEEGERFAVAVRRKLNKGGAVVVNVDASYLLEFRKKIGFGKVLQDIGDNSGIEYILLQDEQGIIAASKSVEEINPIESDMFLEHAFKSDSSFSRTTDFKGHDVFEVVKTLRVKGDKLGLIRLGLSMEQMNALEATLGKRLQSLADALSGTPYGKAVRDGIEHLQDRGSYALLDRELESQLFSTLRGARFLVFGPGPIIAHTVAKEHEISMVRLVMVAKSNRIPEERIVARLPVLYA